MAFNLGYHSLCDKNIQRLYTTTHIKQPAKRRRWPHKAEFKAELHHLGRKLADATRYMDYSPLHDIELPRAAAFRCKKTGEVKAIVKRLTMAPSDRFNFEHTNRGAADHDYNDWKTASELKRQRMLDTLIMFGGGGVGDKSSRKTPRKPEPEVTYEKERNLEMMIKKSKKERKEKKRKKSMKAGLIEIPELKSLAENLPDI